MLKPIDVRDIPGRNETPVKAEIEGFIGLNKDAVEVEIPYGRKAGNLRSTYDRTIRKNKFPVKTVKRGERLFLVRTDKGGGIRHV